MNTDHLDPKIQKLIAAAVKYCELAERCHEFQENKTKELQRAANLARNGQQDEAKKILQRQQLSATVVFDFTDAQKNLMRACKPFRKAKTHG